MLYKDEEKKFDVRVAEKHIRKGNITRGQLATHLKNLPDVSSNLDDEYHFELFPAQKKVQAGSPPSQPEEDTATPEDENEA